MGNLSNFLFAGPRAAEAQRLADIDQRKAAYLLQVEDAQRQAQIRAMTQEAIRRMEAEDAIRRAAITKDAEAQAGAFKQFENNPYFMNSDLARQLMANRAAATGSQGDITRQEARNKFAGQFGQAQGQLDVTGTEANVDEALGRRLVAPVQTANSLERLTEDTASIPFRGQTERSGLGIKLLLDQRAKALAENAIKTPNLAYDINAADLAQQNALLGEQIKNTANQSASQLRPTQIDSQLLRAKIAGGEPLSRDTYFGGVNYRGPSEGIEYTENPIKGLLPIPQVVRKAGEIENTDRRIYPQDYPNAGVPFRNPPQPGAFNSTGGVPVRSPFVPVPEVPPTAPTNPSRSATTPPTPAQIESLAGKGFIDDIKVRRLTNPKISLRTLLGNLLQQPGKGSKGADREQVLVRLLGLSDADLQNLFD